MIKKLNLDKKIWTSKNIISRTASKEPVRSWEGDSVYIWWVFLFLLHVDKQNVERVRLDQQVARIKGEVVFWMSLDTPLEPYS